MYVTRRQGATGSDLFGEVVILKITVTGGVVVVCTARGKAAAIATIGAPIPAIAPITHGPGRRVAADHGLEVGQIDELVGLAAQLVRHHRRLGLQGGNGR